MSEWYYAHGGEQKGPVPVSELQRLAGTGDFDPAADLVWREGMEDWKPAGMIEELAPAFQPATPTPVDAPAAPAPGEVNPYAAPAANQEVQASSGNLPPVKPVNYGLIVGLLVLGFIGFVIGYGWLIASGGLEPNAAPDDVPPAAVITMLVGLIPLVIGGILSLICLYRAWVLLQPHTAFSTPGKAVGFLFIPLFNFYWMFVAYWRWSQEWNRIVVTSGGHPQAPRMAEGLFLTYAILNVCGIIPIVSAFTGLAGLVVYLIILKNMADAVNYAAVR